MPERASSGRGDSQSWEDKFPLIYGKQRPGYPLAGQPAFAPGERAELAATTARRFQPRGAHPWQPRGFGPSQGQFEASRAATEQRALHVQRQEQLGEMDRAASIVDRVGSAGDPEAFQKFIQESAANAAQRAAGVQAPIPRFRADLTGRKRAIGKLLDMEPEELEPGEARRVAAYEGTQQARAARKAIGAERRAARVEGREVNALKLARLEKGGELTPQEMLEAGAGSEQIQLHPQMQRMALAQEFAKSLGAGLGSMENVTPEMITAMPEAIAKILDAGAAGEGVAARETKYGAVQEYLANNPEGLRALKEAHATATEDPEKLVDVLRQEEVPREMGEPYLQKITGNPAASYENPRPPGFLGRLFGGKPKLGSQPVYPPAMPATAPIGAMSVSDFSRRKRQGLSR